MNYYRGNLHEDREREPERNGWLIGQFMNEKKLDYRGTDKMAIKFWQFKKGQITNHKTKYQKFATECTVILKGKIKARIGSEEMILLAGEYIVLPPNTISNLALEILEDAEGMTIKAPSCIPDDTIKIDF